jgi:hypothetical protein
MTNLHGYAAVVVTDGPIQENVKVKTIDRSDQSPKDEAEVIHWMHVRAAAFVRERRVIVEQGDGKWDESAKIQLLYEIIVRK